MNLTTDLVSFLKKSLAENFIFKQWNTYFSSGKKISQQYINSYCENTKIDTSVLLKLFVRELNFNQVYLSKNEFRALLHHVGNMTLEFTHLTHARPLLREYGNITYYQLKDEIERGNA